jgi:hypothetical protein
VREVVREESRSGGGDRIRTSGESETLRSVESEFRPTRTDVLIVALPNEMPVTLVSKLLPLFLIITLSSIFFLGTLFLLCT